MGVPSGDRPALSVGTAIDEVKETGTIRHRLESLAFAIAGSTALCVVGLVLFAVGQPIWTDDVWWHLALGKAYLNAGPLLVEDPLLFTAAGPPAPASWLADIVLYQAWAIGGATALRLLHVGFVGAILVVVWSILNRAGRSPLAATLGTALFAALSAYRLVQLRPALATILATLLLFRLLVESGRVPSWRRVLASGVLLGCWANLHPGYPLGPVLMLAAAGFLFLVSLMRVEADAALLARRRSLCWIAAVVLMVGLSALHPMGLEGYSKAFSVGIGTENVAFVVDEWARFQPFVWPTSRLPPSPFDWLLIWWMVVAVPIGAWLMLRPLWGPPSGRPDSSHAPCMHSAATVDPALVALSLVSVIAILAATRFTWLCVFPIALFCSLCRVHGVHLGERLRADLRRAPVAAVLGALLLFGFLSIGGWSSISRGLPTTWGGYRVPYAFTKYHVPAVWFLADVGLEGNLLGRYSEGGFQSFWLAPKMRTALNGSLNATPENFQAAMAILARSGTPETPRFEDALDALGVDVFFGSGLPTRVLPGRPPHYSTTHLEGSDGWVPVFRNLDSSLYLRASERNKANLDRVERYYAARGISFSRDEGFLVSRALVEAPDWSRAYGVWTPILAPAAGGIETAESYATRSAAYLALGLYREAEVLNDFVLRARPADLEAHLRRVWLWVRPGRAYDSVDDRNRLRVAARALAGLPGKSERAHELLAIAEDLVRGEFVSRARRLRAAVLDLSEARVLSRSLSGVEVRPKAD